MELNELNLSEEQLTAVQKYAQSEADKVRTKYSAELKSAQEELAKYKPAEKSPEEIALEERVAALEKSEAELSVKERCIAIEKKLTDRGLPAELGAYLNLGDNEDESLDKIGGFFLSGSNVPGNHAKNAGMSKDQFKKLSYAERARLYKENPALFQKLAN